MKKFLIVAAALGALSTAAWADNANYPVDTPSATSTSKSFIYPGPYTVNPAGYSDRVAPRNLNNLNEPQHSRKDFIVEDTIPN